MTAWEDLVALLEDLAADSTAADSSSAAHGLREGSAAVTLEVCCLVERVSDCECMRMHGNKQEKHLNETNLIIAYWYSSVE